MLLPDGPGLIAEEELAFRPTPAPLKIPTGVRKVKKLRPNNQVEPMIPPARVPYSLGRSVSASEAFVNHDVPVDVPDKSRYIELELPDVDEDYPPRQHTIAENEIEISQEELAEIETRMGDETEEMSKTITQIAVSMFALDESDSMVETVFRDGFDMEYERDEGIFNAFPHLFRLALIEKVAGKLSMREATLSNLMLHLTENISRSIVEDMTKKKSADKLVEYLRYLNKNGATPEGDQIPENLLGVRSSRR
jgi:hypothetical protein